MHASPQVHQWGLFSVVCALLLVTGVLWAADGPPQAAIAIARPLATDAGFEILTAGGNAFDAAVAVSAALAVVEPYSSGLGGGGFWLLYRAEDGRELILDGRERAPLAAHRDMYLDPDGRFVPELSLNGPLAAGILGEPVALVHLTEHYGRLPLVQSLAPAIRLALDGFAMDERYRRFAGQRLAVLLESSAAAEQFLRDGEVPPTGTLILQPDLADTLERLANTGREGFYAGRTAQLLITDGARPAASGPPRTWRPIRPLPRLAPGQCRGAALFRQCAPGADAQHALALRPGGPDGRRPDPPVGGGHAPHPPLLCRQSARDIDPDQATPSRPQRCGRRAPIPPTFPSWTGRAAGWPPPSASTIPSVPGSYHRVPACC